MTDSPTLIEPAPPPEKRPWILFLLVTVAFGGLAYQQVELTQQLKAVAETQTRAAETTKTQLDTLGRGIKSVTAETAQQSALIHRALGMVLPMKVPEETARILNNIEQQLSVPETWPTDTAALEVLMDTVRKVVDESPPWVQEAILPSVVPARWTLEGLWLLEQALPTGLDELDDLSQRIATHRLNRPPNTPDALAARLAARSATLEEHTPQLAKVAAIVHAQQAIDGTADLAEALLRLKDFDGAEVEAKQARVLSALQRDELRVRLDVMEGEAKRFKNLDAQDLKERIATSFLGAVQDLRLAALATETTDKEIASRIDALMKTATHHMTVVRTEANTRAAALLRDYQVWALSQINAVPSLERLEDHQIKQIKSTIDRNNPLGGDRKAAKRRGQDQLVEELISRLSVIDARLLDDAVGEWYRRVFSDRFGSLDGPHQLKVVEGFASATKKAIEGSL